ncbi:MAG: purine-binding chemotaxis protein CheW [Gemmatimonadetes bacterium]|nr:purine-binding chemotaxis protein CheW [Gemmatimonadota bacterium]MBI3569280.1 purine-binding chemotaxis protein CheW [Gemmatimonadota bacterium]
MTHTASVAAVSQHGGKYLTFVLAGEEYGMQILSVHEILGLLPVTRIPRTPAHIRGVINLRGKVIPVLDLRLRFGMPSVVDTETSCIIVVQVQGTQMGLVVDQVSEVTTIAGADIEPPPSFGADVPTDFILGIGKSAGRVRLLLDIDRVLSSDEVVEAAAAAADAG